MDERYRDPFDVFQPIWAAVGRVASAYGGIESGLRTQLDDFLGETAHSRVVVHNLPTDTVIRLGERLLREIPAYAPAEPLGGWILKACRRAGDERASVAHGSWHMVERGPSDYVGERAPARGNEFLRLAADDIIAHADTISRLSVMLGSLGHMARNAIPASVYQDPGGPMRDCHDHISRALRDQAQRCPVVGA